jgi:two-component system OmpR family response regulator
VNQLNKTKILCVDDEAEWRRMVGIFLKLAGFEVLAAQDGTEAMQLAETEPVGAVILDVNLGGEDGAELIGFLKANDPDVPIILYTGLDHDADAIRRLLAQGADQYLRKGNLRDLIKCVEDILRKRDPKGLLGRRARLQTSDWQLV